jgi:hypothetical protein
MFFLYLLDFRYKALIAFLYYNIQRGQQIGSSSELRNLCLRSTSFYFILLGIPGSGAFNIFHPVLFAKALETFKLALKLHLVSQIPLEIDF